MAEQVVNIDYSEYDIAMSKFNYVQICGHKGHPNANRNGVIVEHRLVMSDFLKRPLLAGEVVHHVNGNPKDNRIENLELTTVVEHPGKHARSKQMMTLNCAYCGRKFVKEARQIKTKQKRGQVDFYCNRHCMAYHFGGGRAKNRG